MIDIYDVTMSTNLGTVDGKVISCDRTEQINGDNSLSFSSVLDATVSGLINATNVIKLNDDWFDIASYKKSQNGSNVPSVSVECEHISYRLNNSVYNVEYFTETGTPTAILTAILNGTGFTVGTVDFTASVTFSLQQATSRRALLMQFVAYLGGEVEFSGFTVSIRTARGSSTPKDLTANKNLTVMAHSVDKRTLDKNGNPTVAYECAVYNPVEPLSLGDVVTLNYSLLDIDVSLRIVSITTNPYDSRDVSVEIGNYVNSLEDDLYRIETQAVSKDALMNGCRIGPEYGFECVRNDKKARAFFKSDGLKFQAGDGSGSNWTDKIYFDPLTGTYVFDGTLSADVITALSAVITPNLYAEKATIAELTVDRLDTSTKVAKYLASDTSDVNYIRAEGQTIQFITASTTGTTTEQATDRNSNPLYWVDSEHKASTTEDTGLPVTVYVYTEAVKAEFSFYDDTGTYVPRIVMGAGTGTGDNDKLIFSKPPQEATIKYKTEQGKEAGVFFRQDGFVDVTQRRASILVNTTDGTITVTPEGIGQSDIVIGYTETNGKLTLTWPDNEVYTVEVRA